MGHKLCLIWSFLEGQRKSIKKDFQFYITRINEEHCMCSLIAT